MRRFYLHFAAAYGTIWIIIVIYTTINSSAVIAGKFQLYVLFPVLSTIYALFAIRKKNSTQNYTPEKKMEIIEQKLAELKNEQILRDGNQHSL